MVLFSLLFGLERGEEYLFDSVYGTTLHAGTASHTFSIVDYRQIILDGNGILRAEFFALLASDTRVCTDGTGVGTLVAVVTHHGDIGLFGHHADDVLGANGGAHAATQTKGSVDVSDAVLHADGLGGADQRAITKAETAETAGIGTVGNALVGGFLGCGFTVSIAVDKGNHMANGLRLDTDDVTDLLGGVVAAGNAEIGGGVAAPQRGRVVVTALEAAGTAVDAGQGITDLFYFFVLFHTEQGNDQCEQDTEQKTDRYDNAERG